MSEFNTSGGFAFVPAETSPRRSRTEGPASSFVLLTDTSFHGTGSGTQTSTTAVTPSPPTPSPSLDTPASPAAGVPHKPSSSTGALAGGVCGSVLLLAVLTFLLLRRRKRRRPGYPRHPRELDPAPFTPMTSENIYSANQSAVVRARMDTPQVNGVQNKTQEDGIKRRNKSAPESSVLAPASSQSTVEKHSQRAMAPQREENVEDANLSLPGSSREALLEEVVALRMRIELIEGLNNPFPRPSSGRASASESDAPPDYEDVGIVL